ncbi:hypothetical protein LOZ53_002462 [Ophidiomyces ophidiicola]|nr:hypothetical protein LOZ53_002462 [Ophidiomyces ophidiicola]KAI1993408.1 hypothetical protein LOZ54_001328 [Ophidiomyces ophidiicola]KAI1997009.1 hypothetical protein LOZ51_003172 [Ophidiomyces ophidiicola]
MNVKEFDEDLLEMYECRKSFFVDDMRYIQSHRSKIRWDLGPIFKERVIEGHDEICGMYVSEAVAVCVATQVEGPNPGLQGIAKIRMQIPNPGRIATAPVRASTRCGFELYNLRQLSRLGCTCTPKLLDTAWSVQDENDPVPGGFCAFFIMEKLPGHNLNNFGALPMAERNQIRLSFAKSIREFYDLRYDHDDPARRNLIWDSEKKKCYIIDLEEAYEISDADKPRAFSPELHWRDWGIAGPEPSTSYYGLDPMVPHDKKYIENPSDEMLEKMAADAEGKDVIMPSR